jgi:hypothetical protein
MVSVDWVNVVLDGLLVLGLSGFLVRCDGSVTAWLPMAGTSSASSASGAADSCALPLP